MIYKTKWNVPSLKCPNRHKLIAHCVKKAGRHTTAMDHAINGTFYIISYRILRTHHFSHKSRMSLRFSRQSYQPFHVIGLRIEASLHKSSYLSFSHCSNIRRASLHFRHKAHCLDFVQSTCSISRVLTFNRL